MLLTLLACNRPVPADRAVESMDVWVNPDGEFLFVGVDMDVAHTVVGCPYPADMDSVTANGEPLQFDIDTSTFRSPRNGCFNRSLSASVEVPAEADVVLEFPSLEGWDHTYEDVGGFDVELLTGLSGLGAGDEMTLQLHAMSERYAPSLEIELVRYTSNGTEKSQVVPTWPPDADSRIYATVPADWAGAIREVRMSGEAALDGCPGDPDECEAWASANVFLGGQ